MSGLLSDIKTMNEGARPNGCSIHRILTELAPADQADLVSALADPSVMHVAIARALVARGIDINPDGKSIANHRRACCGCARG